MPHILSPKLSPGAPTAPVLSLVFCPQYYFVPSVFSTKINNFWIHSLLQLPYSLQHEEHTPTWRLTLGFWKLLGKFWRIHELGESHWEIESLMIHPFFAGGFYQAFPSVQRCHGNVKNKIEVQFPSSTKKKSLLVSINFACFSVQGKFNSCPLFVFDFLTRKTLFQKSRRWSLLL